MSGKINIVFGFFYLSLTAVLGPAYLVPQLGGERAAMGQATKVVAEVRTAAGDGAADVLPAKNSVAVAGVLDALKAQDISGKAAHSHGNLEALLNIVAGFILLSLAIPASFSALITLLFIAGACFHSGMLYLGQVFGQFWAFKLLLIGEVSLLSGLVLMGVAAAIGIKGSPKRA